MATDSTNQFTNDHKACGDSHAYLKRGFLIVLRAVDGVDDNEACADRPLGIVLMRLWVAEMEPHTVANDLCDVAVKALCDVGDDPVKPADHCAQVFRSSRADKAVESTMSQNMIVN
jgi:hypothetical protein